MPVLPLRTDRAGAGAGVFGRIYRKRGVMPKTQITLSNETRAVLRLRDEIRQGLSVGLRERTGLPDSLETEQVVAIYVQAASVIKLANGTLSVDSVGH